jgi:hypothetical protein
MRVGKVANRWSCDGSGFDVGACVDRSRGCATRRCAFLRYAAGEAQDGAASEAQPADSSLRWKTGNAFAQY